MVICCALQDSATDLLVAGVAAVSLHEDQQHCRRIRECLKQQTSLYPLLYGGILSTVSSGHVVLHFLSVKFDTSTLFVCRIFQWRICTDAAQLPCTIMDVLVVA